MLATKKSFVPLFLLLLFILNGSQGCLNSNIVKEPIFIKTNASFFKECACDVTNSKNSADDLVWLDASGSRDIGQRWRLETEPTVYTERSNYSLTLYMPRASRELSGEYTCTTRNNNGASYTYVHTYPIEVYDPVQFIDTKSDQGIVKGRDSLISCQAVGYTQPEFHWHKNDEVIKFGNGEKYIKTAGGIVVKNVTEDDEGTYTCTASVFTTTETVSKYIRVTVFTQPEIKQLVAYPQMTVVSGQELVLDCAAEGIPAPEFTWMKVSNYEGYTEEKAFSWHQDKNRLIFKNIQEIDRGTYQCTATNAAGTNSKNITIEVNTPPVVQSFENFTGDEGSKGSLICTASGRPRPNISLLYGTDDRLDDDISISFNISDLSETSTEFELFFESLKRNYAGNYTCIASNEVGNVSQVAVVSVNHKPYFDQEVETQFGWDGAVVQLKCEPDSQPPARIVWSYKDSTLSNFVRGNEANSNQYLNISIDKDSSKYGQYTCTASNKLGSATKVIYLDKGYPPTKIWNVQIRDIKASTVRVTFDKPESGPNITSYTAEYDETDIYRAQSIHQNRTWAPDGIEFKLEKLKPGTKYLIRIAATNGVGTGAYSELVEFETPQKSAPEAPEFGALTPEPLERKLAIKLIQPDDNGDPIDYYHIKYCPLIDIGTGEVNQTMCKVVTSPANEEKVELTDLENGKTYFIEMFAHNSEGNSPVKTANIIMPPATSSNFLLSAGAIIGLAVLLVVLAILLLDLLLCATMRKGMIATCCLKKKKKNITVNSRAEQKGLLRDNRDTTGANAVRPNNGHKEYEHNKNTNDVTIGKHSQV